MNPSGQVAVVTGGGSGLGEATARALAAKGAKVAVFDVGIEKAQKVAADIGGIALKVDVSSAEAGEAAFEEVSAKLGTPRILVNCAGIGIAMKTTGKEGAHPLDLYEKVIKVNLIGTFNMIRLMAVRAEKLDPLDGGERGIIINTASVAAYDAGSAGFARPAGALPAAPRRPVGIRCARLPHRREHDAERRDHPPRRRDPHGAALRTGANAGRTLRGEKYSS